MTRMDSAEMRAYAAALRARGWEPGSHIALELLDKAASSLDAAIVRAERAEADRAKLRQAIHQIIGVGQPYDEVLRIARRVLEETGDEH